MALAVRQIGPDDWRDWRGARLEALRVAPESFGTRLADVVDAEDAWRSRIDAADGCFLATIDGAVVGMVAADPAEDGLSLQSMFVTERARGHGVGRALVDAVVHHADGRPVHLCVVEGNTRARTVYERAGFRHDGAEADADRHLHLDYIPDSEEPHHHAR